MTLLSLPSLFALNTRSDSINAQGIQPQRLKVIGEGLQITKRKQIPTRESCKR